jgi:hypothetical protein
MFTPIQRDLATKGKAGGVLGFTFTLQHNQPVNQSINQSSETAADGREAERRPCLKGDVVDSRGAGGAALYACWSWCDGGALHAHSMDVPPAWVHACVSGSHEWDKCRVLLLLGRGNAA